MIYINTKIHDHIGIITWNRAQQGNAFDDILLAELLNALNTLIAQSEVRLLLLKGQGKHFSAGADLQWMQRMAQCSEAENQEDALLLAQVLYTLYHCPIPTLAMVQGAAFGGGAGLVAACDIAIGAESAHFCFSEVKLGLIPAVISPYVIRAMGERIATWLFMSAETLDAKRAFELQLLQHCVPTNELETFTMNLAHRIVHWAPQAVKQAKTLVREVHACPIDDALKQKTAAWIAKIRISAEAQQGLHAFLNKQPLFWE